MKIFSKVTAASLAIVLALPVSAFAAADFYLGQEYPNVCIGEKIPQEEIGGTRSPIAPKYKNALFGDLFTADDCGEARLKELFGGEDALYDKGSSLTFKKRPTVFLRRLLRVIGYEQELCQAGASDCGLRYRLDKPVAYYKLLLLKPHAKTLERIIEYSDCINCG